MELLEIWIHWISPEVSDSSETTRDCWASRRAWETDRFPVIPDFLDIHWSLHFVATRSCYKLSHTSDWVFVCCTDGRDQCWFFSRLRRLEEFLTPSFPSRFPTPCFLYSIVKIQRKNSSPSSPDLSRILCTRRKINIGRDNNSVGRQEKGGSGSFESSRPRAGWFNPRIAISPHTKRNFTQWSHNTHVSKTQTFNYKKWDLFLFLFSVRMSWNVCGTQLTFEE